MVNVQEGRPLMQVVPPATAFPQRPQLLLSVRTSSSQPFEATPSQSPNPAAHATTPQRLPEQ
jgi:hypothetical protein